MITVEMGDITNMKVDAVVNAANSSLMGGGGVDGAIHRKGGPRILKECMEIRERQGECATGHAVITSGGQLPAKFVIHTVGPVWHGGTRNERDLLASAYKNSLSLAEENKAATVAFPNISTGVYGFPKLPAAEIAIATVRNYMEKATVLKQVIFVCFDQENYNIYKTLMKD